MTLTELTWQILSLCLLVVAAGYLALASRIICCYDNLAFVQPSMGQDIKI